MIYCNAGYVVRSKSTAPYGCSLNYYASKIDELLAETQSPVVAEIGGGFGGLAYYLLKMRNTAYINFDLPEVLLVAQYFLMMAFPKKRFLFYGEGYPDLSLSTMANYDVILLPNFELPKLAASSVDVFVNTHSLSEMDNPTVKEYLTQIERVTKKIFYHENSETRRDIGYGSLEVPADTFLSSLGNFQLTYRQKAIWREDRYWEYLFEKKGTAQ